MVLVGIGGDSVNGRRRRGGFGPDGWNNAVDVCRRTILVSISFVVE